jgi:hypothetical protein
MIILSAIVADTGWHWMLERAGALWAAPWPRPTLAGTAVLAFWIAGILLAAGAISLIAKRLPSRANHAPLAAERAATDA